MTPWTLAIGYRRFQQGVLIRFGRAREVGLGTGVRLATNAMALAVGAAIQGLPGIVGGAAAVAFGVLAEAIFAGIPGPPVRPGALTLARASLPPRRARRL